MSDPTKATTTESQYEFDAFLAHNSEDKQAVRKIAQELKRRGLRPWLDEEQIPPGIAFSDAIQEALQTVKTGAIFIGSQGLGKWEEEEQKVILKKCVEKGMIMIPVLLPGIDKIPENLANKLSFLFTRKSVSFAQKTDEVKALDELEWGITNRKPIRDRYGIFVNVLKTEASCFLAMPEKGLGDIYESAKDAAEKVSVGKIGLQLIQARRQERGSTFAKDITDITELFHSH